MKKPEETEEMQAQEISLKVAMAEIAWQAFSFHYQQFNAKDADDNDDLNIKYDHSVRMLEYMREYRSLKGV